MEMVQGTDFTAAERAAEGARRSGLTGLRRAATRPYLLLAPSFLFLLLFTYLPILRVARDSLYLQNLGDAAGRFVGLANYGRLVADDKFRTALLNNLLYAGATLPPTIILAIAFAVFLKRSTRVNAVIRACLFFPAVVPLTAAAGLWIFIFLPNGGLIDYYLGRFGVRGINWLGNPDLALGALSLLTVWKNAGYYMLFYIAGLQAIPEEALEAATLDGATSWQRFRYVTLPLLKPTTAFVAVIALINVVTNVDHVIVMTHGGPNNATNLLLYYIFQTQTEFHDPGKATAATVVSLACLLAISLFGLRTLERGIRDGR
ncbi:MAG: carbohydrate ABC transporter permease [Alphaproteobacteria bacterium]